MKNKIGSIYRSIRKRFYDRDFCIRISAAATAALIALTGFLVGRIIIPVSDFSVAEKKTALMETDRDYLTAEAEGKSLAKDIEDLQSDRERIESTFDDVIDYEKQYDALKKEYGSVTEELNSAKSQLDSARKEESRLNKSLSELKRETITLSPGTYIVSRHIPAGKYLVTGNGGFLVADDNKTLKTNILLDSYTPFECELDDNDALKLSTKAEFVPEEGE